MPGVRKMASDNEHSVIERAVRETSININISDVSYCSSQVVRNERGTEFSDLRFVEYKGKETEGFFDVDNLPENIIDFHIPLIKKAHEEFMEKI
jgi:hypothetical protein